MIKTATASYCKHPAHSRHAIMQSCTERTLKKTAVRFLISRSNTARVLWENAWWRRRRSFCLTWKIFISLPITAPLLSSSQTTEGTLRYRLSLLKDRRPTLYIIYIYIKKRLTFVPVPADSVHHSGGSLEYWLSVQPTNRISSHYSAHVFSGQPISRIDTIGDNGKHPPAYPPAAGGHRAPR